MALLKFISLSVGSLMLLQGAYGGSTDKATDASECIETMNKARSEVGLPKLTAVKEDNKKFLAPSDQKADFLAKVCGLLKAEKPIIVSSASAFQGTAAAYGLQGQSCSDAVEAWKKGFSKITTDTKSLPVAFAVSDESVNAGSGFGNIQVGEAPYDTVDAVNFVGLYNGQDNPTVECATVDCALTEAGVTRLVCMTYPAALTKDHQPYTEAQWQGILKVFAPSTSSASAAVPTVLALAAAAVGVALI